MTADNFAQNEYKDYIIYGELAKIEPIPEFKQILNELKDHELGDYNFWLQFSQKKHFKVNKLEIWFLKIVRKILGLNFTAKLLERHERTAIKNYRKFLETTDSKTRKQVQHIIEHEEYHEKTLINQIKEERIKFTGSIVLGLNDGLIELTGVLFGFSFAFQNPLTVAVAGLIAGVVAALSMTSSAYLQARAEIGKNPKKAGFYTGSAYLVVVALLILPFFLFSNIFLALGVMLFTVLVIVLTISTYTSIIFERDFKRSFSETFILSLGVAFISFLIGTVARILIGVEI